ncbi:uracil-DNA glycosylase [Teredinibacter franksiae]|uniref:uracil-DNA glycosylase n=1 Tax=Teredinibacter franksiae TaxID=2761453 RepID=UPI0016268642|nr:uracil-DNA glycosylase [Teredinibacter franksiae]
MDLGSEINLHPSWMTAVGGEFNKPYMQQLCNFLRTEKEAEKAIYPDSSLIFNALNATPFSEVKVVILGQDPYHGPGQAHGLCFSVLPGVRIPPSLRNIFKEINQELGIPIPDQGCLQGWAAQGVLLLNATLTVEQARPGSHQGKGWETFTDAVVQALNKQTDRLVFLLWGGYAQKKGQIIDNTRHYVLTSAHPSPLSAHRGFLGNGHFAKTNEFLTSRNLLPIDWSLS